MASGNWKRGFVAALAVLVVGCGGGDDDTGDDSSSVGEGPGADPGGPSKVPISGDITEAEFLSAFSAAICRGLEPCCQEAGFSYNEALCVALTSPAQSLPASVVFDGQSAAACLMEVQTFDGTCRTDADVDVCDRVYVGDKAAGDACSDTAECAIPQEGERDCDGFDQVCKVIRRGAAEEPCAESCQETGAGGWICNTANFNPSPTDDVVQCWREDGLICDGEVCSVLGGPGDPCSFDDDCSNDAYCGGATCTARAAVGQPCRSSDECATGSYCDVTCQSKKAMSEACTLGDECVGGSCDAGVCGADDALGDASALVLSFVCGG